MSLIRSLLNHDSPEKRIENIPDNYTVTEKFDTYRSKAEVIENEHKQAKELIERLKNDISMSRELEKSYQQKIQNLKNRLSVLEENRKDFSDLLSKQRYMNDSIKDMDEKIMDIRNLVMELKEKFQNVIKSSFNEIDTIKENKLLQISLKKKENLLEKTKSEMELILREKNELIQQYVSYNEQLSKELRESKLEAEGIRNYHKKNVDIYEKKILEYQQAVKRMENERKSLFEDYEVSNIPPNVIDSEKKIQNDGLERPDSTVTFLTDTKEVTTLESISEQDNSSSGCLETILKLPQAHLCKKDVSKFPKIGIRKKPKLDFFDPNIELSRKHSQSQPKRHLYDGSDN